MLRPGGVLAYWCYGFVEIGDGCDRIARELYDYLDDYWPPERALVERGYRDLPPPWPALPVPDFAMQVCWRAEQFLDYAATWSASQRFRKATGEDPVARYAARLRERWGGARRTLRWPLALSVCRRPRDA